jgi:hypothetical protein
MKLTDNDVAVLAALHQYYVLSASQIHRCCFAQNRDRRATRRRLQRLVCERFISRSTLNVAFSTGNAGPAYYLAGRGAEALAVYFDDPAYLSANTQPPRLDRLYHWLDIAEAHSIVRQAAARTPGVSLVRWINEWQTICDEAGNPGSYVLHVQFREQPKPLSCSPDAAFLLDVAGHRRVHLVEIDRGTTGAKRVAASKMPGFCELLRTQGHRRYFPDTTFDDFAVLFITSSAARRDIVRSCVAQHADQHPDLWLFIDTHDFRPDTALVGSIAYDVTGHVGPLVALPPEVPAESGEVP